MLIRGFRNKGWVFYFCIFLILFLFSSTAFAVPHITRAKPEPFIERPGKHIKQRLTERLSKYLFAPPAYPAVVNVLFLMVEFQEENPDDLTTAANGLWSNCTDGCNNDPNYWINKAENDFKNYWYEVSYGKLIINVTISSKAYQLPQNISYYGNESSKALENLIYDSIAASDNDIDFSQYDPVLIVHAGAGEESDVDGDTPDDIWSLYYSDTCISKNDINANGCLTVDNKVITEIIIMPQTDSQDGRVVDPIGVYAHEFGHWLGLPDLYCTALICTLDGVGKWSLMGDGIYNADPATCSGNTCIYGSSPAHLDAWSKVYLGWVTPQTLATSPDPGSKSLNNIELNKEMIKLQASASTSAQYFLLENRQLIGFDKGLPGHGMLVWLIDQDIINSGLSSNTINNNQTRPGVKLIEADGDFALLNAYDDNDIGKPSDPYPGINSNTAFTPQSSPASTPYTGDAWVNVKSISEASGVVSFNVGFSPTPPQNLNINSQTISWSQNTEPDIASYKVYKNGDFLTQATGNSYTDGSAITGDIYRVSAVDTNDNESVPSNTVTASISGGGGGGGCFIATAAYGSYLAPEVKILRQFRDEYLLANLKFQISNFKLEIPNVIGRRFVEFYYKASPPIADYIREHENLRTVVRFTLTPVVYGIKYVGIFIIVIISFLTVIALVLIRRLGR